MRRVLHTGPINCKASEHIASNPYMWPKTVLQRERRWQGTGVDEGLSRTLDVGKSLGVLRRMQQNFPQLPPVPPSGGARHAPAPAPFHPAKNQNQITKSKRPSRRHSMIHKRVRASTLPHMQGSQSH